MSLAETGAKIVKAIFQNKWLSIEYKNKQGERTSYWIGVLDIDSEAGIIAAEGFHVTRHTVASLGRLSIASILSAEIIDESWHNSPEPLKEKIRQNPEQFERLFGYAANLHILDYLYDCARMNSTPYKSQYALIERLDDDALRDGEYALSGNQFGKLVRDFQSSAKKKNTFTLTKYLCMNMLSICTERGLYVLAYRGLRLDAKRRALAPDAEITVCKEFQIGKGEKESARRFLDNDDLELLNDFEANLEAIKDALSRRLRFPREKVDDMPYIMPISRRINLNLENEYGFIKEAMASGSAETPLRAFFGELTKLPDRRKKYPLALLSKKANMDQLLAMHTAIKYPLCYVQGPPGTGKTATIINTIVAAFFNGRPVLFSTFNNHPIDEVCAALETLSYKGNVVPFPVFRVGNNAVTLASLNAWRERYLRYCNTPVIDEKIERDKEKEIARAERFAEIISRYEERLGLEEKKGAIEKLLAISGNMTYQLKLPALLEEAERQIAELGDVSGEEALSLLYTNQDELLQWVYFASIKRIKQLGRSENRELLDILLMEDDEEKVSLFNSYIKAKENVVRFLKVFPVVAATCISCGKIGEPGVYFDMAIIDEAGQCDIAHSLVPILRARQLMLVGDPQQLSPVIVLDPRANAALKKAHKVSDEYDFAKNSVYQAFLSADSVSREILLSHHYRCPAEVIAFNNQKYYNGQLKVESPRAEKFPLAFCDVPSAGTSEKNAAPAEAEAAVEYAKANPQETVAIITPFVRQKKLVDELIRENGLANASCGTIHAFQGDEKDVVLLSLAVTEKTPAGTYEWLKGNRELINVATSRAKSRLVVFGNEAQIERLHNETERKAIAAPQASQESGKEAGKDDAGKIDDVFDLVQYIKSRGKHSVAPHKTASRALGVKPFSTQTEEEFLQTLGHALDNVLTRAGKCVLRKEVPISAVFEAGDIEPDLFYKGRFDFVIFERGANRRELPILAIELDGKEHREREVVMRRDAAKNAICRAHRLDLIRVDNTYARRYHYIKEILERFFARR